MSMSLEHRPAQDGSAPWRQTFAAGLTALMIVSSISRPAVAASPSWHITGQVGGPTSAVAVHGSLAYVGVGFRLRVYDLSNPAAPLQVGESSPFSDFVAGVATDGALAYVAAGRAGVRILDVTDPARPSEVGAWDSPGNAEGIAVVGAVAYVADGPFGLRALDVSDPCRPVALGSAFETSFAFGVAVQGGHAFVAAAGAGLLVADVKDPAHLVEVATLDTPGFTRAVATSGTIAYLADQWGGVRIISIADPAHPVEIGSFALPSWAFGVALSGSTLLVADGSQGLRALDVSDPRSPREVGAYPITWQHAAAVTVTDGTAYVAVRGEGLHVVDVRNPAAPRRLSGASQLAEARAAVAVGDLAYVAAADQGLRVVDLAAGAREIGVIEAGDFAYCVATMGQRTLVVGSTGIGSPGVRFFDLSDPVTPRAQSVLAGPRINPTDISVQGSLVAISGEPGIHLIDASDPAAPAVLSFLDMTANGTLADLVWDVALAGSTALVAQSGSGLRLVDITDPRNPRVVGTYKPETLVFAQAVAAEGRYAYVLGGPSGLHVVDISDPRAPLTVAVLRPLVGGERMRLQGTTLLIAGGASGLITVDVTDPARPTITGSARLPGYAYGVAQAGERVLVSSGDAGLFVLQPELGRANAQGSRASWTASDGAVAEPTAARWLAGPVGLLGARPAAAGVARPRADAERAAVRGSAVASARTLVVRSAADSGTGTLREALAGLQAGDTVTFDPAAFPQGAPATIRVSQQLPCLCKDGVTIDASNAGVVIDGSGAPPGTIGLVVAANESRIMGLEIIRFDHSGIWIQGSRNVIGGDRSRGTGPSGQGNVVSGNKFSGINFPDSAASGNRIVGNLIGTDATGTRPLGQPQSKGVFLFPGGPGNTIGGTEPWEANVISGNALAEVFLQQARADTIAGNLIGTDPTGTKRVGGALMGIGTGGHSSDHLITGNVIVAAQQGIIVSDSGSFYNQIVGNRIGIGRDGGALAQVDAGNGSGVAVSQSYNRIADNVISGNTEWGITFGFWGSHDSVVTGNLIGTDPTGKEARPNGRASGGGGISLYTLTHGFIGGASAPERNVIAGNAGSGIVLSGPGTGGNFILGNLVGTDSSGQSPLGNSRFGVDIGASDRNFVEENVIAWSGLAGIFLADSSGNRLRRNSIHSNASGGIGLGQGSDRLPAAPSISSVTRTRVAGSTCAGCTIEVFSDAGRQGRTFEGETVAGADGTFQLTKAIGSLSGPNVTATATDADGSTSAFSEPTVLPARPDVARLFLGTAEGAPGGSAVVSLSFEAGPNPVSALDVEITAAPPLAYSAALAGAAAALAGKQVFTDPIPGGARIRLEGAAPDRIGDGVVASVTFAIASGSAAGTYGVAAAKASARAVDGSSVTALASNGSVTIRPETAPLETWTLPSSAPCARSGNVLDDRPDASQFG